MSKSCEGQPISYKEMKGTSQLSIHFHRGIWNNIYPSLSLSPSTLYFLIHPSVVTLLVAFLTWGGTIAAEPYLCKMMSHPVCKLFSDACMENHTAVKSGGDPADDANPRDSCHWWVAHHHHRMVHRRIYHLCECHASAKLVQVMHELEDDPARKLYRRAVSRSIQRRASAAALDVGLDTMFLSSFERTSSSRSVRPTSRHGKTCKNSSSKGSACSMWSACVRVNLIRPQFEHPQQVPCIDDGGAKHNKHGISCLRSSNKRCMLFLFLPLVIARQEAWCTSNPPWLFGEGVRGDAVTTAATVYARDRTSHPSEKESQKQIKE